MWEREVEKGDCTRERWVVREGGMKGDVVRQFVRRWAEGGDFFCSLAMTVGVPLPCQLRFDGRGLI